MFLLCIFDNELGFFFLIFPSGKHASVSADQRQLKLKINLIKDNILSVFCSYQQALFLVLKLGRMAKVIVWVTLNRLRSTITTLCFISPISIISNFNLTHPISHLTPLSTLRQLQLSCCNHSTRCRNIIQLHLNLQSITTMLTMAMAVI